MGDRSAIEWTNATWNVITGCSKVSSGCKNCYAERLFPRAYPGREFTDVRTHPERLEQPLKWKRPRRIFVNSMSDLFHEAVADHFIEQVFAVMALAEQHTFQILTKRPERMAEWASKKQWSATHICIEIEKDREGGRDYLWNSHAPTAPWKPWPLSNVWLGVSVEDQATADERIPLLLKTPAAVMFVSYEPALGPVDFRHIQRNHEVEIDALMGDHGVHRPLAGRSDARLDWVIAGGESGPRARPSHPDWFRSVRDQCQTAGVAFFFKQWGCWIPHDLPVHGTHYEHVGADKYAMKRVSSKKSAGRLLDGREWSEYPRPRSVDKLLWR
jgi:protein gp37